MYNLYSLLVLSFAFFTFSLYHCCTVQNDVPDGEGGRERDAGGHQEAPEGRHDYQATR